MGLISLFCSDRICRSFCNIFHQVDTSGQQRGASDGLCPSQTEPQRQPPHCICGYMQPSLSTPLTHPALRWQALGPWGAMGR